MARPSDAGSVDLSHHSDLIDTATFDQILEMDDDDQKEFSRSIVYDFFTQAESTFGKMDSALQHRDLAQLSSLGHFLKGSSATLGLNKVRDSCEKIQHYGAKKDDTGQRDISDEDLCLDRLKTTIARAKEEFKEVESLLKRYYNNPA